MMCKRFLATYDLKIVSGDPENPGDCEIYPKRKIIKANTFRDAREKIRTMYRYDVVNIDIVEAPKTWLKKLFSKKRRVVIK